MKFFLFLTMTIAVFTIVGSEAIIADQIDTIAQAHHLKDNDLALFKLIANCRYHDVKCKNPLIFEHIATILQPDFDKKTASALQKAIFKLLKPIINAYNQAISPAIHSSLTQQQQYLLIDIAKCIFFKLNCEVKSRLLLLEKSENLEEKRSIPAPFETDLNNAYRIALESGMVLGVAPTQSLENYQDATFLTLSQKFDLNPADQDLFLRFIRFINEYNADSAAEALYIETTKLDSHLLGLKNCLTQPACFQETTGTNFISQENAMLMYDYNARTIMQEKNSTIQAAYEYFKIYNQQKYTKDLEQRLAALKVDLPKTAAFDRPKSISAQVAASEGPVETPIDISSLKQRLDALWDDLDSHSKATTTDTADLKPVDISSIKQNLAALVADLPTEGTISDPNPLAIDIISSVTLPAPITHVDLPNKETTVTRPAININNLAEIEQKLSQTGYTYSELITMNFTNKKQLVNGDQTEFIAPKATELPSKELIDTNNLVDLERLLINKSGYHYSNLINSNLITKQSLI